jgi:hypothetical protein
MEFQRRDGRGRRLWISGNTRNSVLRATWYGIFVLVLGFHLREVEALPSWLIPVKGVTLAEEIQCYGIPYGGIGFASHILTYYTLICLYNGRRPLWPWKRMKHSEWDMFLAVVQFFFSIGLATFTIIRCRNRWEFVLIVVWKMCLSATLALTAFTVAVISKPKSRSRNETPDPPERDEISDSAGWLILYVLGLIVGLVGLGSVVKETWNDNTIRIITYVFGSVCGLVALVFAVGGLFDVRKNENTDGLLAGPGAAIVVTVVLGALYSDWILGTIAYNLVGVPSSDIAILYWTYFVAKRLPMFSL